MSLNKRSSGSETKKAQGYERLLEAAMETLVSLRKIQLFYLPKGWKNLEVELYRAELYYMPVLMSLMVLLMAPIIILIMLIKPETTTPWIKKLSECNIEAIMQLIILSVIFLAALTVMWLVIKDKWPYTKEKSTTTPQRVWYELTKSASMRHSSATSKSQYKKVPCTFCTQIT